ncbi:MAG: anti-sigma factor family protein, partial [Planctomycetota bacterium]
MTEHPDRDDLQDFVYGFLPDESAEAVRDHLGECTECRDRRKLVEDEKKAVAEALAPLPVSAQDMDRIVSDMLDSPAGGLVGPRSLDRKKHIRDPLSSVTRRAIVLGVTAGVLTFFVFTLLWEAFLGPDRPGPRPIPRGNRTTIELRALVNDFLRGDQTAKKSLLSAGGPAIRILYEERAGKPLPEFRKMSDLMFTLRFLGESDARVLEARDLLARELCLVREVTEHYEGMWEHVRSAAALRGPVGFACDASVFRGDVLNRLPPFRTDTSGSGPAWKAYQVLEYATACLGLDYAVRCGTLIVSTPERLWPYPLDDRKPLPDGEMTKHFAALETDEARRALLGGGREVIAFLEKQKAKGPAEARRLEIISRMRARYNGFAFDQNLSLDRQPSDGGLRDALAKTQVPGAPAFEGDRLDAVLGTLARGTGLSLKHPAPIADRKVWAAFAGGPLRDALLLICKLHDLDLCSRNGALWIDTRQNIARFLGRN